MLKFAIGWIVLGIVITIDVYVSHYEDALRRETSAAKKTGKPVNYSFWKHEGFVDSEEGFFLTLILTILVFTICSIIWPITLSFYCPKPKKMKGS
jgi:hypothetical protein